MHSDFLPILLTLCSAFLFALGGQLQSRGLASGTNSRSGTALSISSAALCYWLVSPIMLDPSHFLNSAVFIFVLVGIFFLLIFWLLVVLLFYILDQLLQFFSLISRFGSIRFWRNFGFRLDLCDGFFEGIVDDLVGLL